MFLKKYYKRKRTKAVIAKLGSSFFHELANNRGFRRYVEAKHPKLNKEIEVAVELINGLNIK
jgi:hypothetical protein